MMNIRITKSFAALAGAALLAGCGGSGNSGDKTGYLSLGVSDMPIHSAKKVCITFDDIELKQVGDEPPFLVDLPQTKVNLLAFQGMNAAPLLFNEEVPAGEYEWMRLVIDASMGGNGGVGDDPTDLENCAGDASYIVMDDDTNTIHNIFVPSGDQTGLKLVGGFTVPVNASADFTAEWDLMQSMTAPPGLDPDVILKPVIRLVNNAEVGTLRGTVSADLAAAEGCEPAVYVFDNVNLEGSDVGVGDPSAGGMVKLVENPDETTSWVYEIGFLVAGSYEAAFTCTAAESAEPVFVEPVEGNPFEIVPPGIEERNFE